MEIRVLADAMAVASEAAKVIAGEARAAVAARGRFIMAVSGGHTPWEMLRALAREEVPWKSVYVAQMDERVVPEGDPDRNLTHLRDSLLEHAPLRPGHICAMPVESPDLEAAAARYSLLLQKIAGSPPVLDLVHLGLGPDGHTASLVPGDPVLKVTEADVAMTRDRKSVVQGKRGCLSDWSSDVCSSDLCSTSFILASGLTAIPPRWFPATRYSRSPKPMSQ